MTHQRCKDRYGVFRRSRRAGYGHCRRSRKRRASLRNCAVLGRPRTRATCHFAAVRAVAPAAGGQIRFRLCHEHRKKERIHYRRQHGKGGQPAHGSSLHRSSVRSALFFGHSGVLFGGGLGIVLIENQARMLGALSWFCSVWLGYATFLINDPVLVHLHLQRPRQASNFGFG